MKSLEQFLNNIKKSAWVHRLDFFIWPPRAAAPWRMARASGKLTAIPFRTQSWQNSRGYSMIVQNKRQEDKVEQYITQATDWMHYGLNMG